MARVSARDRLLAAAERRFYSDGVNATGIDAITAEAGVAKMSLYNNFASKADLVSAYIEHRHTEWLALLDARTALAANDRDRVLAVFDAYLDHANDDYPNGFRGCGLLNAAAEFPAGDPGRAAVRAHKEEVERILIERIAPIAGPAAAPGLAEHFSFLLEGAVARAGLAGSPDLLLRARGIAERMLEVV
ncbi:TetR/AcrR family transcriptional regulator [Leucobacter sp. CSA2]|uniref:TetR/AcrR family transcriptional regulator n=1 Tax=Leucobacter edaphi TaxID=2796472 RepID=A0A934UW44_9MICO|nr:TetR/AcrR family transcriptional regulator [Leucobacter edaphi]MBK0420575.1 TetR/AcrR family transcriptional regulator [Leucobacter edaphi]